MVWITKKSDNKNGAALATVVMILFVMMVLIIPILASSLSETKQTVKYERIMQAHYTARIGAEVLASSVIDDQSMENIDALINASGVSDIVNGNSFTAKLSSLDESYDNLLIESTGTVSEESETVFLTLSRSGNFFRYAIFGDVLLGLGGSMNTTVIGGDVGTNTNTHSGNVQFVPEENSIQYNQQFEMDPINVDFYTSNNASFINTIDSEREIVLKDYPVYATTSIGDPVVLLRVPEINLSGNDKVIVKGPGELHILVEKNFQMSGNSSFAYNSETPNTKIYIDYNGTSEFGFNGHLQINGYIYAPNATIGINGGVGNIVGSFMAKKIDIRGGNFAITFSTELSDESIAATYRIVGWND